MSKHAGFPFDELMLDIGEFSSAPIGGKPIEFAKTSLLDWLGVAIAGEHYSRPQLHAIGFRSQGAVSVDGCATTVGNGGLSDPVSAAFHNGIAGHVLDFDDVLITRHQPLHPTAPIAPALLATAECVPVRGEDVLRALVLGVEAIYRLAQMIDGAHFAHGWHVTATLGTVGASVGAGLLLRLEPRQLRQAIWLAATQMSGVRASLGTFAKPLQVGKAASTGLTCAFLARANARLEPCLDQRDWPDSAYSIKGESAATTGAPKRFAVEAILYKHYPCCGESHDAINSILHMDQPPPWQSIRRIRIFAPGSSIELAGVSKPTNGLAAKFSIPYCTSAALLHRKVGLTEFDESAVADPRIADLLGRTEMIPHDAKGTRVELEFQDGATLSVKPDIARNIKEIAARHDFVRAKFVENVAPLIGQPLCEELMGLVLNLDKHTSLKRVSEALRRVT